MRIVWVFFFIVCFSAFGICGERILLDKEVTVARSDYQEVHFRVPEDTPSKVQFQGTFTCVGGLNDDITFMAFNQENYVRWFNQWKHKFLVKKEKIKEGSFQFEGEPGQTYYFVLNNFFSSVSNKKVRLQIKMIVPDTETQTSAGSQP